MSTNISNLIGKGSKKIPLGVKVISILYYIGAVICLISGLVIVFSSNAMAASIVASNPGMGLETIPSGTFIALIIAIGVILIIASFFAVLIGRGIWKLKRWARITVIVLGILGFLSAIFSMVIGFKFTQIISLLVDIFIVGYLGFSKEAKSVFK